MYFIAKNLTVQPPHPSLQRRNRFIHGGYAPARVVRLLIEVIQVISLSDMTFT